MKKLIGALAGLAVFAPAAMASSHFLKVSPAKTNPGKTITISGSVGRGCEIGHKGDSATIYSAAFKGATKHTFAGVPSVSVSLANSRTGAFSHKLKLSSKVKKGTYTVSGRCGGGKFGSTTLRLVKAVSGFYY